MTLFPDYYEPYRKAGFSFEEYQEIEQKSMWEALKVKRQMDKENEERRVKLIASYTPQKLFKEFLSFQKKFEENDRRNFWYKSDGDKKAPKRFKLRGPRKVVRKTPKEKVFNGKLLMQKIRDGIDTVVSPVESTISSGVDKIKRDNLSKQMNAYLADKFDIHPYSWDELPDKAKEDFELNGSSGYNPLVIPLHKGEDYVHMQFMANLDYHEWHFFDFKGVDHMLCFLDSKDIVRRTHVLMEIDHAMDDDYLLDLGSKIQSYFLENRKKELRDAVLIPIKAHHIEIQEAFSLKPEEKRKRRAKGKIVTVDYRFVDPKTVK